MTVELKIDAEKEATADESAMAAASVPTAESPAFESLTPQESSIDTKAATIALFSEAWPRAIQANAPAGLYHSEEFALA
ncbi:MAG: hypothetical protein U0231_16510 [Nitrospiraceae bacterium]